MEVGRRFQPLEYGDGLKLAAKLFLKTRKPGKHLTPSAKRPDHTRA